LFPGETASQKMLTVTLTLKQEIVKLVGKNIMNDKPYTPPEIIYETELETKAGTPLGDPDPGFLFPELDE